MKQTIKSLLAVILTSIAFVAMAGDVSVEKASSDLMVTQQRFIEQTQHQPMGNKGKNRNFLRHITQIYQAEKDMNAAEAIYEDAVAFAKSKNKNFIDRSYTEPAGLAEAKAYWASLKPERDANIPAEPEGQDAQ